jgi:hypothetical protein
MSKSRFVKQSAKTAIIRIQAAKAAALVSDLSVALPRRKISAPSRIGEGGFGKQKLKEVLT